MKKDTATLSTKQGEILDILVVHLYLVYMGLSTYYRNDKKTYAESNCWMSMATMS